LVEIIIPVSVEVLGELHFSESRSLSSFTCESESKLWRSRKQSTQTRHWCQWMFWRLFAESLQSNFEQELPLFDAGQSSQALGKFDDECDNSSPVKHEREKAVLPSSSRRGESALMPIKQRRSRQCTTNDTMFMAQTYPNWSRLTSFWFSFQRKCTRVPRRRLIVHRTLDQD
jgi:hypothetical protein